MIIDWSRPIRTINTHFPVRLICKDFKGLRDYSYLILVDLSGEEHIRAVNFLGEQANVGICIENVPDAFVDLNLEIDNLKDMCSRGVYELRLVLKEISKQGMHNNFLSDVNNRILSAIQILEEK
jgi:hypothetical protein